jgi:hypothetical protein
MRSRFDTTTPPGFSSVTAKSAGALTGSVAWIGTTTSSEADEGAIGEQLEKTIAGRDHRAASSPVEGVPGMGTSPSASRTRMRPRRACTFTVLNGMPIEVATSSCERP